MLLSLCLENYVLLSKILNFPKELFVAGACNTFRIIINGHTDLLKQTHKLHQMCCVLCYGWVDQQALAIVVTAYSKSYAQHSTRLTVTHTFLKTQEQDCHRWKEWCCLNSHYLPDQCNWKRKILVIRSASLSISTRCWCEICLFWWIWLRKVLDGIFGIAVMALHSRLIRFIDILRFE